MRKVACVVFILVMIIFLINPLISDAGGGYYGGGHYGGGYWGWWAPWAIVGGTVALASYYAPHYYSPYYYDYPYPYYYYPYYYVSPKVVIREKPSAYVRPAPTAERLFIYPRKGQSEKLQEKDTYDCHRWSVGQTNYDPIQPSADISESQTVQKHSDYNRALTACLDAKGYTAK